MFDYFNVAIRQNLYMKTFSTHILAIGFNPTSLCFIVLKEFEKVTCAIHS